MENKYHDEHYLPIVTRSRMIMGRVFLLYFKHQIDLLQQGFAQNFSGCCRLLHHQPTPSGLMNSKVIKLVFVLLAILPLPIVVKAQEGAAHFIPQQFAQYQKAFFQEKIFVHTDRSFYVAGETIWFKVYCMNAQKAGLLSLSKVAYLEILDASNTPIVQVKMALDSGLGNGSVTLPAGMHSGRFLLRAYTSWMKNFDPDFYFHQPLDIINAQTFVSVPGIAAPIGHELTFFPEGGTLVNGIQTKMAFRVADDRDKGVDFAGAITDQNNDTLLQFRPGPFGIGSFMFTPQKGKEYKAVVLLQDGSRFAKPLPVATDVGLVMNLKEQDSAHVLVSIQSADNKGNAFLFVHSQGRVVKKLLLPLVDGGASLLLNKEELGEGISHVTLFNEQGQPVCERLYFKRPTRQSVKVTADKREYSQRSKVSVALTAENEKGNSLPVHASMSVFLLDSLSAINPADIFTYYHLLSELQGNVESPQFYFKDTTINTIVALDNLMLTHGWRRFKWPDVLAATKPVLRHLPELEGHIISGTVVQRKGGRPAAGVQAFLSFPGKDVKLFTSRSDDSGHIMFNTQGVYGNRMAVASLKGVDSIYRVDLKHPFSESFASLKNPLGVHINLDSQRLLQRSINAQVYQAFYGNAQEQIRPGRMDTLPFYGTASKVYRLDDYTRFPTMEEVLVEYVPEIAVRKRQGVYQFIMATRTEYDIAEIRNPTVLLDGVPLFDGGAAMVQFDPRKVERLEVVIPNYFMGTAKFDGIASFFTYDGKLGGYELDTFHTIVDFDALQTQREFYAPRYNPTQASADRRADFRTLLFWNGNIKLNATGTHTVDFFTSDLPGKYAVVVQGIGVDGRLLANQFLFDVVGVE
jgi:hypothetical protein